MVSENFYAGVDYGFNSDWGKEYSVSTSGTYAAPSTASVGFATDITTANQLKATSDKLNTGAKTVELSAVNILGGPPGSLLDKIPKQHFKEINRLKKLTGVDLTFHGPLIEPTGIGERSWDPNQRVQAEKQIWNAIDRAHDLEPDGNVVVTFHSSNGLPEPRTRIKNEEGREVSAGISVINETTGEFGALPKPSKDYLFMEEPDVDKELTRLNEQRWSNGLNNLNLSASRGREFFEQFDKKLKGEGNLKNLNIYELYKKSTGEKGQEFLQKLEPGARKLANALIDNFSYADISARDSYSGFKDLFNQAYSAAEKSENSEDLSKLDRLRAEITPVVKEYEQDPSKVMELANTISKGIRILDNIKPPQVFRPLEEFAVDKASETFSNVALTSYKKFGDSSPIISIENPPVGMGLSRADDIRNLVVASREKFAQKLKKQGLSEGEAEKQAEKLIGTTWDVGHINMIRKYGYDESDVVKESEKIAPYVKHVHLSDNFGLEHTELPMGMGNVPIKKILELSEKFRKAKKIVETGDWFSRTGLGIGYSPVKESLRAFGSPLYSMQMAPNWKQAADASGGYFTGYGQILPEQHFGSLYGAGFSNLPPELGGQMGGRARVGGAPIE